MKPLFIVGKTPYGIFGILPVGSSIKKLDTEAGTAPFRAFTSKYIYVLGLPGKRRQ